MSVLFPTVNKPREWDFRPRYYDPEKDKRQQKLRRLQAEREKQKAKDKGTDATNTSATESYVHNLHRGSFREAREHQSRYTAQRTSRLAFWITLLGLILFGIYLLS